MAKKADVFLVRRRMPLFLARFAASLPARSTVGAP
jgi:hypothetical protein